MDDTKTYQIGHGIFLYDKEDIEIRSEYAKKKLEKGEGSVDYFYILERESTIELQNGIHGRSRHQIYLNHREDFLAVMKELNPQRYESYIKREEKDGSK